MNEQDSRDLHNLKLSTLYAELVLVVSVCFYLLSPVSAYSPILKLSFLTPFVCLGILLSILSNRVENKLMRYMFKENKLHYVVIFMGKIVFKCTFQLLINLFDWIENVTKVTPKDYCNVKIREEIKKDIKFWYNESYLLDKSEKEDIVW